jgi:hypothetical protein
LRHRTFTSGPLEVGLQFDPDRSGRLCIYWDLATTEGLAWSEIVNVMDAAIPHSWNAVSLGADPDDPPLRVQMAAALFGVSTEVATQMAINGVDR